ncbi:MAG: hypothetical protein RMX68_025925 [Aulosira sp. ZfuVER01]|nr:hypothetical protein [Aulosira sp. ZfuVER01]MDZ8001860.1 hypothetical protein [Aulosira sp. DedVER01a]MDZ8053336.1 hypothetical protein [Aulosira sp. ZfuCHP01]
MPYSSQAIPYKIFAIALQINTSEIFYQVWVYGTPIESTLVISHKIGSKIPGKLLRHWSKYYTDLKIEARSKCDRLHS